MTCSGSRHLLWEDTVETKGGSRQGAVHLPVGKINPRREMFLCVERKLIFLLLAGIDLWRCR